MVIMGACGGFIEDLARTRPHHVYSQLTMKTTYVIRQLVAKALHIKQLTPDIENEINYELTRLGYISDADYEALELLMSEMDAGRIRLVPSP
jgi:hypothetical protein